MGTSDTHVREHRSVLAAAEKRVLMWIAMRLPRAPIGVCPSKASAAPIDAGLAL